jgi:hypothetical protein
MNDEGFAWLIGVAMWLFCIARSAWLFNSPCRSVLVVPNASMNSTYRFSEVWRTVNDSPR